MIKQGHKFHPHHPNIDDRDVVLASDYDTLAAQRDEGLAREAELRKQLERLSILAAARLHDLNEIGKEIARAELAFRCALPFVQARCDETDYGDASARTTLEMIKELLKTFETSPGCADGEKEQ